MRKLLAGLMVILLSVTAQVQTDLIQNVNGRITSSLN